MILTGGALEGSLARTWVAPNESQGGPTLLTCSERSQVLIYGDRRGRLIGVATAMKAYGDVDRPLMPGFGNL